MPAPRRRLQARRFLGRHALLPVALASTLAVALFAGRVYRSESTIYSFLIWNLFLAWVPYLASQWAGHLHQRCPGRWRALLLPSVLWLAFFPNGPYLVTDFWHLQ